MAPAGAAVLLQRWQRFTRRQRLIAAVAGIGLTSWVADAAALRPLRRHLHQQRRAVVQTEQQLLAAMAANQNAAAVTKAFVAYQAYAQPSGSVEAEMAALLNDVEASVRQSGMTLLNLKPVTGRTPSDQAVSVAIDGESTPEQLVRLLDRFQRSPHALKVTELAVRASESKTLRASLVVSKLLLK